MWHIGQRVVCIREVKDSEEKKIIPVKKGCIYTIRHIIFYKEQAALLLTEIVNKEKYTVVGLTEQGYHERLFKPLDEKRLDIFREMLTVKEREKEIVND